MVFVRQACLPGCYTVSPGPYDLGRLGGYHIQSLSRLEGTQDKFNKLTNLSALGGLPPIRLNAWADVFRGPVRLALNNLSAAVVFGVHHTGTKVGRE